MTHALLAEVSGTALMKVLGRFHPAAVHFPIALLTVAAAIEAVRMIRKQAGPSPATPMLVVLGAVSAVASTALGWILEEYDGGEGGDLVAIHKWVGIAATVVALVAAGAALKPNCCAASLKVLRASLFIGSALVGLAGYFGGELVFGKNYHWAPLTEKPKKNPPPPTPVPAGNGESAALLKAGTPDFAKEVAPVLAKLCLRCHGGEKVKGKLNLKTREGFLKGGEGGKCVTPGKPAESSAYTLMIETDPETKMPPPKEKPQPTPAEIELIKRWIESGAEWPAGVDLK